jgi:hypothetical protein
LTKVDSADPENAENDPEPISVVGMNDCGADPENVADPSPTCIASASRAIIASPENSADPEPISLNVFFSTLDPENSKRTVESGGLTPVASADPENAENDPEPISAVGINA